MRCLGLTAQPPQNVIQAVEPRDRTSPSPRLLSGYHARIDACLADVMRDGALSGNHGPIGDIDVTGKADLAADAAAPSNAGTASNPGLSGDHRVRADDDVVADLHQIVDLHAVANDRVSQSASVDAGVGANLHACAQNHPPNLGDLLVARIGLREAEAIGPNDGIAVDNAVLSKNRPSQNLDPG